MPNTSGWKLWRLACDPPGHPPPGRGRPVLQFVTPFRQSRPDAPVLLHLSPKTVHSRPNDDRNMGTNKADDLQIYRPATLERLVELRGFEPLPPTLPAGFT